MPKEYQVTLTQNAAKRAFSSLKRANELMQEHNPNAFVTIKHTRR